jgi:hypothetical protein
MNSFEASATVGEQGQVVVTGVPFEPGTVVEVTISLKAARLGEQVPSPSDLSAARDRMRELFQTVKGFRMAPKLSREELYDRRSFH